MGVKLERAEVLIEDGETVSTTVVDMRERYLVGIYIPSGFEGTALTFQAAHASGGTFLAVYEDAGNAVSFTVAQSRYVSLGSSAGARAIESVPFLKLVAGTQQTGDITLILLTVPRVA